MNPKVKAIHDLHVKRNNALEKLSVAARPIVAVLKDHKLDNTSLDLAAALFEFDAIEAELSNIIHSDPQGVLGALLEDLERRSR